MLTGQNGILKQTVTAKEMTEVATENEVSNNYNATIAYRNLMLN